MLSLKKFYKRNQIDCLMFGYISAFRLNFPAVSIDKALNNFIKDYSIDSEELSFDAARQTYYRMEKEYTDIRKEPL